MNNAEIFTEVVVAAQESVLEASKSKYEKGGGGVIISRTSPFSNYIITSRRGYPTTGGAYIPVPLKTDDFKVNRTAARAMADVLRANNINCRVECYVDD